MLCLLNDSDPVAVYGLVVAIIAMLAAIAAAYFAWRAPDKNDLARNTTLLEHLANRSLRQDKLERIDFLANSFSASVTGKGVASQPFTIHLSVEDFEPEFSNIERVSLRDEAGLMFGEEFCDEVFNDEGQHSVKYTLEFSSATMRRWFDGGTSLQPVNQKRLYLSLFVVMKDSQTATRTMPVIVSDIKMRDDDNSSLLQQGWTIEGSV